MSGVAGRSFLYIDFEFSDSNEKVLKLTSCSWKINDGKTKHVWLYNEERTQKELAAHLKRFQHTHTFVAYAATAECRSFQALGLNPRHFKWIDLFFEQRQLTHTCHKFKYGRYVSKTGMWRKSIPPSYIARQNEGKDNNPVGIGYVDAVANHLGIYVDSVHKREMRDLILAKKPVYDELEKSAIMNYCDEDVEHLPSLHNVMSKGLAKSVDGSLEEILEFQITRGRYAANLAYMESQGMPIQVDSVRNLRKNFETAKHTLINELVTTHYPFYLLQKKRKRDLKGVWVDKYTQFEIFINKCDKIPTLDRSKARKIQREFGFDPKTICKAWPRSPKTGKYKTDEKTLEKYDGIPELYAYRQAKKLIGQLKWFQKSKKADEGDFFDNVGSDNRLRPYLGGYGTQTSRNAPKAKQFIFAMSSWLRCLVKPEEGETIVAIDWASQEFIIAALLSADKNMIEAYSSGDPYLYFAIEADGCSQEDGDWWKIEKKRKEECEKNDIPFVSEDPAKFKLISGIRNLFKATTLGLQYGMGFENLAIKLTADTGKLVTENEANNLIRLHHKIYSVYWDWLDDMVAAYKKSGYLMLHDGWSLLANQDNDLSIKNLPVQGTGAVIMRLAIDLFIERGGHPIAPLHDAIYAEFDNETEAHHPKLLGECMQEAVEIVLGKVIIRQDIDIHDHNHTWIEEKGQKYYDMLNQYLDPMMTEDDRLERAHRNIYCF